jgi:hypothetical protein
MVPTSSFGWISVTLTPCGGQFLIEGGGWQNQLRVAACVDQRVAILVPGKGEEQGRDHGVHRRLVVEPLEDAVLAHRLAGVERRHMRAGGGWELRGQPRGAAVVQEAAQERVILKAFQEAPAERVDKEDDHLVVARGQAAAVRRLERGAPPVSFARISPGMSAKEPPP